jgi:outer membrane protein OmpA-like peptidoglycan-associated protein
VLLLAGTALFGAGTPVLTPAPKRITDQRIGRDRATINTFQARIIALNEHGILPTNYHLAKAQAWLDYALDEYNVNDRGRWVEEALAQCDGLLDALEAGKTDIPLDTPIVPTSKIVRPDLWALVKEAKAGGHVACVGLPLARLEVALVYAGHQVVELGWRHARCILGEAERYALAIRDGVSMCKGHTLVVPKAPVTLAPGDDLKLEQANAAGTAATLGLPTPAGFTEKPEISSNAPAIFPAGVTVVTWTAKNAKGELATATQKVTVADTIPPYLKPPPDIVTVMTDPKGTPVALGTPEVRDAVDPHPVVTNNGPERYPLGTTEVTWTAKDAAGNVSKGTQKVTVTATGFGLVPPPDITKEATDSKGTPVALGEAKITGTPALTPAVSNDGPALYKLGITPVVWTAKDAAGFTVKGTQKVTIIDTTAPKLVPPPDITAEVTGREGTPVANLGTPQVSDFADPAPVVSHNGLKLYPMGPTPVVWTAKDAAGNTATGTQKVTIVDTTPPKLVPPPDIVVRLTSTTPITSVTLGDATGSDNSGWPPVFSHDTPRWYPLGATTVNWTAVDPSGNKSTAVQKVIVVDGVKPKIEAPPDIIVEATSKAGTPVALGLAKVRDNIDLNPKVTNDGPKLYPLGRTVVTWTVEDSAGNTADDTQVVTVIDMALPAWVHFAYDSYAIADNTAGILAKTAATLRKYPEISVTLVGHTDPRGSVEYNQRLGMNRAQAIYDYFVKAGVDAKRLKLISVGKGKPVAAGMTEYIHALNRTVELNYFSPRGEITTNRQVDDLQLLKR